MKLVIFGLTISSSWGNGHATLWRGLCSALARRGHKVVFFERDVPYYAAARDLTEMPGDGELILYSEWADVAALAQRHLRDADVAMVTSFCHDAAAASELVVSSGVDVRVFYDLDSPVTLARLRNGEAVPWAGSRGYRDFDLVLSYAGGETLSELRHVLGAQRVAPLYGSVDPAIHRPAAAQERFRAALSYMGTWSADRDEAVRKLLLEPARRLPASRFAIGGSQYGSDFGWLPNIFFLSHIAPSDHPAFYCSSRLTLNVTRGPMAESGYCPSGRLFEASACGVPVLSDIWEGLGSFYDIGTEVLVARTTDEAIEVLNRSDEELARVGRAARERTLACHTADIRAEELETILAGAAVCGA